MKTRKKRTQIEQERRNCLYNKTILHNKELAEKNTELSHKINELENIIIDLACWIGRKRWWQFWRWFK
jgi:hypothetical protein